MFKVNKWLFSTFLVLAVVSYACDSGGDDADSRDPSTTEADLRDYFDELEEVYAAHVNIDEIDPEDPDYAALARQAVEGLEDIEPPSSAQSIHRRLIQAGEDYASSIEALNTVAANADDLDETPSPQVLRAVLEVRRAETDIESACLELLELADSNPIDANPCVTGDEREVNEEPCADFVSEHLVREARDLGDARTIANEIYGESLPFPESVPSTYSEFTAGWVSVSGSQQRTPEPTQVPDGAGIKAATDDPASPDVSISFAPLPECDPNGVYANIEVNDDGGQAVEVSLASTTSFRSSATDSTSESAEYSIMAGYFAVDGKAVTVELGWEEANAPELKDQVAALREWTETLLATE